MDDRGDRRSLRRLARDALGLEAWLPGQEEALRAISAGRDTLALLPTGGGKSAIYQLAGVQRPGSTVVVSPLLALQHDQLGTLQAAEIGGAEAVNSTIAEGRRADILDRFAAGQLEFILVAPEQFANEDLVEGIAAGSPSLFVVDEVHCVSEWGHDFRPEYRRLGTVAEAIGRPPILGLTATASPAVREEITTWLRLNDPVVVARGFDRPNLELSVQRHADETAKRRALVDWVLGAQGPGIVYAATRAASVEIAGLLTDAGARAAPYHAGLGRRQRADTQSAFMDGGIDVVVATIAFGMGIDKADVRFVAHLDVSESLDAYYQEIGRAGRDGQPAAARLFFREEDLGLRRFQAAPAVVTDGDVRAVVRALRRGVASAIPDLAGQAHRSKRKTDAVLGRLEELGVVRVGTDGAVSLARDDAPDTAGIVVAATAAQERRRRLARSRVEMLRGYADTSGCRRRFLLNYLGEEYEPPCDACDNCLAGAGLEAESSGDEPFALNEPVRHVRYGRGTVSRVEAGRLTVLFEEVGYRTFATDEVLERRLLTPSRATPGGPSPSPTEGSTA